ncbi:MAG: DUF58 domain-containing protein [Gammaproteobacteria bacterium]
MRARTAGSAAHAAGAAPDPRQVLGHRRVYILPSRHGALFGAAQLLMLAGAINYDAGLAFALTFLLAGMMLVGILHTWRNLAGLTYAGGRCQPVFAGETACFRLLLDNRAGQARPAIRLQAAAAGRGRRRRWRPPVQITIPAHGLAGADLALPAERRGRLDLGRVRISTRYPLGLLRAWAEIDSGLSCVVYPRPAGTLPLPAGEAGAAQRHTGLQPGSEDFHGFRPYRAGDAPRSIAWKLQARGGPLVVKRFVGAGAGASIALDFAATAGLPGLEARLSQLCRWVLDCESLGLRYALRLPATRIAPGTGPVHRDACLHALALHGLEASQ